MPSFRKNVSHPACRAVTKLITELKAEINAHISKLKPMKDDPAVEHWHRDRRRRGSSGHHEQRRGLHDLDDADGSDHHSHHGSSRHPLMSGPGQDSLGEQRNKVPLSKHSSPTEKGGNHGHTQNHHLSSHELMKTVEEKRENNKQPNRIGLPSLLDRPIQPGNAEDLADEFQALLVAQGWSDAETGEKLGDTMIEAHDVRGQNPESSGQDALQQPSRPEPLLQGAKRQRIEKWLDGVVEMNGHQLKADEVARREREYIDQDEHYRKIEQLLKEATI